MPLLVALRRRRLARLRSIISWCFCHRRNQLSNMGHFLSIDGAMIDWNSEPGLLDESVRKWQSKHPPTQQAPGAICPVRLARLMPACAGVAVCNTMTWPSAWARRPSARRWRRPVRALLRGRSHRPIFAGLWSFKGCPESSGVRKSSGRSRVRLAVNSWEFRYVPDSQLVRCQCSVITRRWFGLPALS